MPTRKDQPAADPETEQARMTFGEHLEELRKRIIRALLGSGIAIIACLFFMNEIMQFLVRPYRLALRYHGLPEMFQYARPHEVVFLYIGIAVKAGLVIASPWIILQLWSFIAAGLYPKERKTVYRYVGPSTLLFLLGVAFFYFFVLPVSLNFFVSFQQRTAGGMPTQTWVERTLYRMLNPGRPDPTPTTAPVTTAATSPLVSAPLNIPILAGTPPRPPDGVAFFWIDATDGQLKKRVGDQITTILSMQQDSLFVNMPRLDDYLNFVTMAALIFGLAFETPMVMMILAQVGIASKTTYRSIRKYAYFALALIAAIVAPGGDITSMLCLMIPLMGLYELGIIISGFVERKLQKEEQTDERSYAD